MVKTTTLDSFQDAERTADEPHPAGNYLADLAERMVSERQGAAQQVGDPFEHLDLTADPGEAYGHLEARLRAWLEERGVWALEDEIRRKADELLADAEQRQPTVTEATYTVAPDGTVDGYTVTERPAAPKSAAASQELPGVEPKPLRVPSDSVFGDDGEFAVSTALAHRARLLIERHGDLFDQISSLSVIYLWKKTGGKSKGRAVFGKTSKPSGLLKHFSECQFVVWLAADHCRAAGYRDREIEALLFHEMLHMGVSEPDENTGRGGGPTLVPHELEMFRAEVEVYGLWAPEIRAAAPAFQQASLFDAEERAVEAELDREEAAQAGYVENPDDGAGILIHPDGTPLTPEEIAEQEAAELADDDYLDDDDADLPL